jgi:hypothetical protein
MACPQCDSHPWIIIFPGPILTSIALLYYPGQCIPLPGDLFPRGTVARRKTTSQGGSSVSGGTRQPYRPFLQRLRKVRFRIDEMRLRTRGPKGTRHMIRFASKTDRTWRSSLMRAPPTIPVSIPSAPCPPPPAIGCSGSCMQSALRVETPRPVSAIRLTAGYFVRLAALLRVFFAAGRLARVDGFAGALACNSLSLTTFSAMAQSSAESPPTKPRRSAIR